MAIEDEKEKKVTQLNLDYAFFSILLLKGNLTNSITEDISSYRLKTPEVHCSYVNIYDGCKLPACNQNIFTYL